MGIAGTTRRSIYADKLRDFPEFAFGDDAALQHRGTWRDFFRRRIGPTFNGRVVFEVGCADAAFLGRIATKYPGTGFVGLDWKCKALYDAARRVASLDVRNIGLLRGRGQDVAKFFGDNELDEVWVFHPDPCDRDVELKNRLIAEPFLTDVHRVLRDEDSVVALKTDHPGYYQWVLGLFGLPEPEWFRAARDSEAAGGAATDGLASIAPEMKATAMNGPATRGGAVAPLPRVRACDLMRPEAVPAPSPAIRRRFGVAITSPDYWHDPAALAHTARRCFAGETTFYESRFARKRHPIYYVEMRKVRGWV
jgi:tRNA G46 methylase TrmB